MQMLFDESLTLPPFPCISGECVVDDFGNLVDPYPSDRWLLSTERWYFAMVAFGLLDAQLGNAEVL
ncbi:hypothetical protein BLA13014_00408 [Burkholderia aenigmatica]|uniref:Uncharacterized protein n=1 Tax=Burkholderia aenigmatica TaxID=2015348 RepID=A0A6P2HC60_9BURK|nr:MULTISPECIES: hypothetical protein [Burkholderia]VWB14972.1 hypothetical protein BLA13014_00408 [Burkholderia aenigmatica]